VNSDELRALAQRVADALPAEVVEEVVLTGGVSRAVADELSDIEMLVVTCEALELSRCFVLAREAGLHELDTWGPDAGPERRVSGRREGVSLELVWWPREHAEARVEALLAGRTTAAGDALAHGVALRTSGRLAAWQAGLRAYPPELAAAHIEQAALRWGGFRPAGLLTVARPGDRLALTEWLVDSATRVLAIVYALNGLWPPTSKRLPARVAPLAVKPDRLAERIEEALVQPDPRRALRVMAELQLETVRLAPPGPCVDRARAWLAEAVELLRGV
jgi:predicted nucleotidyltransferase